MALNLYRRHGSNCHGGHAPHSMSYDADESRRSWKKCSCPIYASGKLGRFNRKNTERTAWDEAKALARTWEDAGAWDTPAKAQPAPVPVPAPVNTVEDGRTTIDDAVKAFTVEYKRHAANTRKKYDLVLKKLKEFSAERGFVMIEQWK